MKRKSISDGGITYGKSHDEGGIKVYNKSTDQMLEVEGGEAVVNKRAMASDEKFELDGKEMSVCEVVSEMNQVGGGVKLDCGDVEDGQFLKNGGQTYSEGGLLAPNGKKSNLTPEQYKLVRTPEFKAWFGDWEKLELAKVRDSGMDDVSLAKLSESVSKVVDSNGEPLVVYRSQEDDRTQKAERQSKHFGIYFSQNRESTRIYGSITKQYFVSLKNPQILEGTKWNLSVIAEHTYNLLRKNGYDGGIWIRNNEMYEIVAFDEEQVKLATNSNPDIRFDDGGQVEDSISKGDVELKIYGTTPEHAKQYGLESVNPLYVQSICVSEPKRLQGLGKKVLAYIEKYAVENGHDVVFGHITQKAKFTKDNRQSFFCDIDMIKNWLHSNGYAINLDNNDFHKVIKLADGSNTTFDGSNPDIRFDDGGELKKGISIEKEHIKTLKKLYEQKITPTQATKEIAQEHIAENPRYYTDMIKSAREHKHKCKHGCNHYSRGGRINSFGSLEGLGKKLLEERGVKSEEEKVIELTINRGRELLDIDYLPVLKANLPDKYKPYLVMYKELNLYKLGWRLQFGSSRDWAGLCSYRSSGTSGQSKVGKDVYLSIQFTKWDRNWRDNADDVILHEIAHALVNEVFKFKLGFAFDSFDPTHKPMEGHGATWEAVCNAINKEGGCSRYYQNKDLMDNFKFFKYICNYCGDTKFSNSQNFAKNCFRCNKPVIVQKNK